ncbi:MAG: EscU/YscU/HrcU family type III secretion system export apparatus switch protein [Rectinemataceae bacterium]|jgi:type III secretion system FlhB-like substrate exporter
MRNKAPGKAKAVALRFWAGLPAPFLAAKAEGRAVDRLIAIAEEAGVPIVEDGPLAQAVFPLEVGAYVPEECFEIVARVFAFVKSIEEI